MSNGNNAGCLTARRCIKSHGIARAERHRSGQREHASAGVRGNGRAGVSPNFLARSLANQTSNSIGLVVSTFDGFYFGRLLQQASRQTETHGKQLIVTDGHDAPEQEEQAVQMLADRKCDAIVLYTRYMSEKAIMKLIHSVQTPLVVINREVSQAPDRCVFFEQQDAAFKAVDYLINQGTGRSPVLPSLSTPLPVKPA
ncbi:HTH-type transcriptional regulator AscG [Enterobacter cloacae]|uniref:HTH-type transcriptional regulator AscG n=1 Tax=Enterobacter cloacae TaxID=550 RepID=A0A377LT21_ENTCL|nr:HTH-type transcriptional regulator AscG [Enterobacter cloacae]